LLVPLSAIASVEASQVTLAAVGEPSAAPAAPRSLDAALGPRRSA
jgi:hypothetical protein